MKVEVVDDAVGESFAKRPEGSDDEYAGLSVSKLWIRGFFCRLVPTLEAPSLDALDVFAASHGVVSKPDDACGNNPSASLNNLRLEACFFETLPSVELLNSS